MVPLLSTLTTPAPNPPTMTPATVISPKVTAAGTTLGRISRNTIRVDEAPMVLAATTNSRLAKDRLAARTTR